MGSDRPQFRSQRITFRPVMVWVCIVLGDWKLEQGKLYRRTQHRAVKDPKVRRWTWDRITLSTVAKSLKNLM